MNQLARRAVPAFVVVALAINLVACGSPPGGPSAEPSRSAAAPSPSTGTPEPSTSSTVFPPAGVLKMGERQAITLEGVRSTFTVPTGDWVNNGSFGIDKSAGTVPEGAGFILWTDTPVGVFSDPCAKAKGPEVGSSVGSLPDAVASMPSIDVVESPVDVRVGGRPAKNVVVRIPEDIGCKPDSFFLWYVPTAGKARYATAIGSTIRTWIVDVDGTTIWFDAETYEGAGYEPG